MIIYPAIDLLAGQCVRLTYGDFKQCQVYNEDPVAVAQEFRQKGATHLHVVDLEGSRSGAPVEAHLIKQLVRESGLKVQVGGGIRRPEHAQDLLEMGVDRIVIGSLAVRDPDVLHRLLMIYGEQRLTLALDLRLGGTDAASARLATEGWTKEAADSPWRVLDLYREWGGTCVLVTDIGRDGALSGANGDLYRYILQHDPGVKLIASGGVTYPEEVQALRDAGVYGAVIGKALYEGRLSLEEALACS